jgi:hypothetical protein
MNTPFLKAIASEKFQNRMNTFIVIGTVISLLGALYWYYRTHIDHPNVELISVDWEKGIAQVKINGKQETVYAGSKFSAGAEWAVGFSNLPDGDEVPDRIEISRGDIVHKVLATKPESGGQS